LLLRSPKTPDSLLPGLAGSAESTVEPVRGAAGRKAEGDPRSETTFKGGIQIAVIRERAGEQSRLTGTVSVKPGDGLRVEVALDRDQTILAAVLGDDASWLELMSAGARSPGTHFSERSARVDATPLRGTILVGSPEAVKRARDTGGMQGVAAVRIEWDGTP
jgi:hypothetical protein